MSRRLLLLAAAAGALSCATAERLHRDADGIRADVARARELGAMRCAPRELARAEVDLDIGQTELVQGDEGIAGEHLRSARSDVTRALELSRACTPVQVTIQDHPAAPAPVVIEVLDRDGDGVPDAIDRCPDEPGPKENGGCPVAKDSDGDGIPDDIDRCPLDPEDHDGFQDEDGCPDPDNDGDGIVDRLDACPNTPGPIENRGCPILDPDRDGDGIPDRLDKCPDEPGPPPDVCPKKYALVEVKKDRLVIRQQIHFASGRWTILPDSFPLLDQVVEVLKDQPGMRVSVEGHTDAIGGEAMNRRLSQARADAVRDYLTSKGVAPARLDAVGYGATQPIASNKTESGRARNRRTEFRIVSRE